MFISYISSKRLFLGLCLGRSSKIFNKISGVLQSSVLDPLLCKLIFIFISHNNRTRADSCSPKHQTNQSSYLLSFQPFFVLWTGIYVPRYGQATFLISWIQSICSIRRATRLYRERRNVWFKSNIRVTFEVNKEIALLGFVTTTDWIFLLSLDRLREW